MLRCIVGVSRRFEGACLFFKTKAARSTRPDTACHVAARHVGECFHTKVAVRLVAVCTVVSVYFNKSTSFDI